MSRTYADSAIAASADVLEQQPNDPQRRVLLGLALAHAGRNAEAIPVGERQILTDKHEKALDRLEELLRSPYYRSPRWLRIDPTFDPLRKHPRFVKLVEGT